MNIRIVTTFKIFMCCLIISSKTICSDHLLLKEAKNAGEAILDTAIYAGLVTTGIWTYKKISKSKSPASSFAKIIAGTLVGGLTYQTIRDMPHFVKIPCIAFSVGALTAGVALNEYYKEKKRPQMNTFVQHNPFTSGCIIGLFFPVWKNAVLPVAKAGASEAIKLVFKK